MACIALPEGAKPVIACTDCGAPSTYTQPGAPGVALVNGPPPGRVRLPVPRRRPHAVARSGIDGR